MLINNPPDLTAVSAGQATIIADIAAHDAAILAAGGKGVALRTKTGGPGHVPLPDGSGSGTVVDGATGVYGAWVQLSAATASALLIDKILAVQSTLGGNGGWGEIQIGIGAGGAEVVQSTQPLPWQPGSRGEETVIAIDLFPPLLIPTGSRVAVRTRTQWNTNASDWNVLLSAIDPANVEAWTP